MSNWMKSFLSLVGAVVIAAPLSAQTLSPVASDDRIQLAQRETGGGGGGGGGGPSAAPSGGGGPRGGGPAVAPRDGGSRGPGSAVSPRDRGKSGGPSVGRKPDNDGERRARPGRDGRDVRPNRRPSDGVVTRPVRRYDRDTIRRRGKSYAWGPGFTFFFYDGYYYGDCQWLRRRAVATGSRYWWQRFRQCRDWN